MKSESTLPFKKRRRFLAEVDESLPEIVAQEDFEGRMKSESTLPFKKRRRFLAEVDEPLPEIVAQPEIVAEEDQIPEEFAAVVEGGRNFVRIVQKKLNWSDINKDRLTLPIQQSNYNFLNESELQKLETNRTLNVNVRNMQEENVNMCIKVHKDGGRTKKFTRVFTSGWKDFAEASSLNVDDVIEVWKYEKDGVPGYLVRKVNV